MKRILGFLMIVIGFNTTLVFAQEELGNEAANSPQKNTGFPIITSALALLPAV